MKEIFDKDSQLKIFVYSKEDLSDSETFSLYKKYIKTLNTWTEDNDVQKYICSDMKLGDFLSTICKHSTSCRSPLIHKHLIAFDNDMLVGTALLTINDHDFKSHIAEKDKYYDILKDKNPLLHIEYLATSPDFRNKGYAARLIESIKTHKKSISDNTQNCGITAVINNENEKSKRAFLKNKFVCTPAKSFVCIEKEFRVYYFGKHKKLFEKDL